VFIVSQYDLFYFPSKGKKNYMCNTLKPLTDMIPKALPEKWVCGSSYQEFLVLEDG
jgi:hypothetical protein